MYGSVPSYELWFQEGSCIWKKQGKRFHVIGKTEQAINTKGGFYLSLSEPYHLSYWCGSFLFVRLIPGQYFTAYKYGKDKYDKFPYKNESFLDQPDCKTYGNPQKPEHQLQEQHTDNKYRQQIYNQQQFKHNV